MSAGLVSGTGSPEVRGVVVVEINRAFQINFGIQVGSDTQGVSHVFAPGLFRERDFGGDRTKNRVEVIGAAEKLSTLLVPGLVTKARHELPFVPSVGVDPLNPHAVWLGLHGSKNPWDIIVGNTIVVVHKRHVVAFGFSHKKVPFGAYLQLAGIALRQKLNPIGDLGANNVEKAVKKNGALLERRHQNGELHPPFEGNGF